MDEVDPQGSDCFLLQLCCIVQHTDVDHDLVGCLPVSRSLSAPAKHHQILNTGQITLVWPPTVPHFPQGMFTTGPMEGGKQAPCKPGVQSPVYSRVAGQPPS